MKRANRIRLEPPILYSLQGLRKKIQFYEKSPRYLLERSPAADSSRLTSCDLTNLWMCRYIELLSHIPELTPSTWKFVRVAVEESYPLSWRRIDSFVTNFAKRYGVDVLPTEVAMSQAVEAFEEFESLDAFDEGGSIGSFQDIESFELLEIPEPLELFDETIPDESPAEAAVRELISLSRCQLLTVITIAERSIISGKSIEKSSGIVFTSGVIARYYC